MQAIPESVLDDTTLEALPSTAPPAPWDCACDAIVWVTRSHRSPLGNHGLPAGLPLAVVGGMVDYLSTPVGSYREVFGAVGLLRGLELSGTIPFMSVDSYASVRGGRQNWNLPKTMSQFTGRPEAGRTMSASGSGWTVRATPRVIGPRVPARFAGKIAQPWPDGAVRTSVLRGRASARLAVVKVEVESEHELANWLRPGLHLGAVLTNAHFHLP